MNKVQIACLQPEEGEGRPT